MKARVWLLLTTVETQKDAAVLSREAIEAGLAACVQIEGPVESVFVWKDFIESAKEYRLLFKTSASRRKDLWQWLQNHHPYEVPELLAWPADESGKAYTRWVEERTH